MKGETKFIIHTLSDGIARDVIGCLANSPKPMTARGISLRVDVFDASFIANVLLRLRSVGMVECLPDETYRLDRANRDAFIADLSQFLCGVQMDSLRHHAAIQDVK
jgi:hypothetical protein